MKFSDVFRIRLTLPLLGLITLATLACYPTITPGPGLADTSTPTLPPTQEVSTRILLGAWTIPEKEESNPFAETLRGFVISDEQQLDEFLIGLRLFRMRGNFENLAETDFSSVVLVATYYMWRPIKGYPLSIRQVSLRDGDVEVTVELDEEALGRELPYLQAPLEIAAIDRQDLPQDAHLRFVFKLNGETATIVEHSLD